MIDGIATARCRTHHDRGENVIVGIVDLVSLEILKFERYLDELTVYLVIIGLFHGSRFIIFVRIIIIDGLNEDQRSLQHVRIERKEGVEQIRRRLTSLMVVVGKRFRQRIAIVRLNDCVTEDNLIVPSERRQGEKHWRKGRSGSIEALTGPIEQIVV